MSGHYRAVLLIDCVNAQVLEDVKAIVARVADEIERYTDGATIQIAGSAEIVRKQDIHTLADEMFVDGETE